MRWPFFFGREPTGKGSPELPARAPLRDWASLPAIQRVLGEPRLTAPTAAFVDSLAGTREPDLSLEPLGHHVSLDAPSGLVTGLARNVETYAASSELVGRPRPRRDMSVQRRLAGSGEEGIASLTADEHAAEELPDPEVVVTAFPVIDEPVFVRSPLTRMADAEANAVTRLAMPRPAVATPAPPDRAPTAADAGPEPAARLLPSQRLTLGQSRRLGLGAPLKPQRTAAVQRAVEAPPLDLAPTARAPREEQAADVASPPAELVGAERDESVTALAEPMAPLAAAPVQRATAGQAPAPALELAPGRPGHASVPEASAASTREAVIQRVVARPLPPIYSRPVSAPTAPLAAAGPSLLILHPPAGSAGVESGTPTGPTVQRAAAGEARQMQSLRPIDGAPFAVDSSARHGVTTLHPAAGGPLPRPAPVAQLAPAAHRVTPAAADFVAFSPFATPAGYVAQRATSPADAQLVQREVAAGEAPTTEPAVASVPVATAASAGAEAAAAPSGDSDKDLDELARKLHDRISLNLRRDLLIQRERAGLVADWR